jgi:hypothetical protein
LPRLASGDFGRSGIPFNAVYGPASLAGEALPELLTVRAVRDAFAAACDADPDADGENLPRVSKRSGRRNGVTVGLIGFDPGIELSPITARALHVVNLG